MKPPPQFLLLLLLWIRGVVLKDCSGLPKRNILLKPLKTLIGVEPRESYMGYLGDKMYFLYCFKPSEPPKTRRSWRAFYDLFTSKNKPTIVITSSKGEHIVTLVGFHCLNDEVVTKKSHMFFKEDLSRNGGKTVLAFGIIQNKGNYWCRYDICIDCGSNQMTMTKPVRFNGEDSKVEFIHWSERGKPLSLKTEEDYNAARSSSIVAEYVSIGYPKVIFTCNKYGKAIIKSMMGQLIVSVSEKACSKESFIQTFYAITMKKDGTAHPEAVDVYQLAKGIKEDDSKWYNGEDLDNRMFYYFLAQRPSKMCYWKKIHSGSPNSCPSLPGDAIMLGISDVYEFGITAEAVRMYKNHATPTIFLICFETNEHEQAEFLSEVTDTKGKHVLTIRNIDCSFKENIDRRLFVQTTKMDPDYFFVGTRWTVGDEWCTYNLQRYNGYTTHKGVYYAYNPEDAVLSWEEVDLHQCPGLDNKNIFAQYKEPPMADLTSRHFGIAHSQADSLLLNCYTSSFEGTNSKPWYTNVIKTLTGEAVVTIIGIECLYEKAKDNLFYISKQIIGQHNYLMIGSRIHSTHEWCQYDFCLDCEKEEVKRNFKIPPLTNAIKWMPKQDSCTGLDREKILTTKPDLEGETATYWNGGNPRFTMRCYSKPKSYAVISSAGKHVMTIEDFDCSKKEDIGQKFYIHTLSGDDDLSNIIVGTMKDKKNWWCFYNVVTDVEKDVWVHRNYQRDELARQWYTEGSCPAIPKENIHLKPIGNNQEMGSLSQTYVSTSHNMFKVLYCYRSGTDYSLVVKSAKGNHELTIKGLDCSELSGFDIFYMKKREKQLMALWTNAGRWCRYDICLNCDEPEINFNINPSNHAYSEKLEWAEVEQTVKETLGFFVHEYSEKVVSTVETNINPEHHTLFAKFVTNDVLKFQLHCYKDLQKDSTYFAVITDANEKHVVTVSNFDCTLRDNKQTEKLNVIIDQRIGDYIVFLILHSTPFSKVYIAVCWNCETSFVMIKKNQRIDFSQTWEQVPLVDCPSLKREDIYIEENKVQFDESKPITSYITAEGKGMYLLHCYSTGDSDNGRKHVSVLKNREGTHLMTIKGLDCSSNEKLSSASYFSIKKSGKKEIISLGTRRLKEDPWCQYDVCITCGTAVKFGGDLIPSKDFLEWSEAGIKMTKDWCPSPKVEESILTNTPRAEYVGPELEGGIHKNTFGLDCYKPDGQNNYKLHLRTSKGLHIATIPTSRDCTKHENLVKQFYVTKTTTKQMHLFKMDQPDIENLIESCWNAQSNEDVTDIWFYYFAKKESIQPIWKQLTEEDKNCPAIRKTDITTIKTLPQAEPKVVYRNGGNSRVTLSCYEGRFATLRTPVTALELKIDGLDCVDGTRIYERLYVDTDSFNFVILGSRKEVDWCWYSIQQPGDETQHVRMFHSYNRNPLGTQWYKEYSYRKGQYKDCPVVKSGNIIINEDKENLFKEAFISMFIVEVFEIERIELFESPSENPSYKVKEVLYNYYYREKDELGRMTSHTLAITTVEGRLLATVKDYDCSLPDSCGLGGKAYMFTMADYLVFGTRKNPNDNWCQYDICLNCEREKVRVNEGTLRGRANKYLWEKVDSESCQSVRIEHIFTNENEKNLLEKMSQSVSLMEVIDSERLMEYTEKEAFLTRCFYEEGADGKRQLMISTVDGRHLATIEEFDCSPQASVALEEKIYMFTLTYNGHEHLALGISSVSSVGDKWCRYDICLGCKTKTVRRNVHRKAGLSRLYRWMPVVEFKNGLSLKDKSREIVIQEHLPDMRPVATYKSGGFRLDCYQISSSSNYNYNSVIFGPHGKRVAEIQDHDCSSLEKLRGELTIFIPKNSDKEYYNGFVLIDIVSTSLDDNYKCCVNLPGKCNFCEKGVGLITSATEEIILKNEWIKVPTEACYDAPRENIFLDSSEIKLQGYKVFETYMNENLKDEDTFVLVCYKNDDLNEGERTIAQLKTLRNKHVVGIKNLDCSSYDTLTKISYMAIVRAEGNRYLALGTRSTRGEGNGPWCRYDICISCANKRILVNPKDDPGSMKTFEWSSTAVEIPAPNKWNTCGGTISSETAVSRYANTKDPEFSIDCHVLREQPSKKLAYCSVFKRHETPLVVTSTADCKGKKALEGNFYLYTLYTDSEFSLVRVGKTKDIDDKSVDKKIIKKQWLYYFLGNENNEESVWNQVQNPNLSLMESIKLDKSEEKDQCLPKSKKWADLEPANPVRSNQDGQH